MIFRAEPSKGLNSYLEPRVVQAGRHPEIGPTEKTIYKSTWYRDKTEAVDADPIKHLWSSEFISQ